MQIVIEVEPRPKGYFVIGSIVERISRAIMHEREDTGEFVLRAPEGGEVVEHKVKWGVYP